MVGLRREDNNNNNNNNGWFEKGRCILPIKVECSRKSNFCWLVGNMTTLTCWGYCQIVDTGLLLSSIIVHVLCVGQYVRFGFLCAPICSRH